MTAPRFANPVFVALDTPDLLQALDLARALKSHVGGLKLGLEFITAQGPAGICAITELGLPVFADVKFHDIPNTVAGAARAIASLGIGIFNIHVSGGEAMMRAAVDAVSAQRNRPRIIGVTVLTSLADDDLRAVGQVGPAPEQVARLARLAQASGLDGVVCSPQEIATVRASCGRDFLIVTPGIRPAGTDLADQRRVTSPEADILVVGRPITAAPDPVNAAKAIIAEIGISTAIA